MNLDEPLGLQIYELKLELLEIEPKIWRRVLVPGSLTLAQLHEVIQTAIGWTNSHLHEFIVGAHSYSDPEFEIEEAKSEYRYRLARLAPRVSNTIAYEYDFGDGWEHQIRVESITEGDKRYPGSRFASKAGEAALLRTAVDREVTRVFSKQLAIEKTKRTKRFLVGLAGVSSVVT